MGAELSLLQGTEQELQGADSNDYIQGENPEVVSLQSFQENVKIFNMDIDSYASQHQSVTNGVSIFSGELFCDTRLTRAKAKLLASHCSASGFDE